MNIVPANNPTGHQSRIFRNKRFLHYLGIIDLYSIGWDGAIGCVVFGFRSWRTCVIVTDKRMMCERHSNMKINKWTIGLTAAGLLPLVTPTQAQDANSVQTKLGATSLSGYVSTTYHWNLGDAPDAISDYSVGGDKSDRFALDVVSLTLASPNSFGDKGAGYKVQMWLGPDASEILEEVNYWPTWV